MTEPVPQTIDEASITQTTARAIDSCPTCGVAVTNLEGRTPVKASLDDAWFAKDICLEPAGLMRWWAEPCGHRVGKPTVHADRIELAAAE